MRLDKVLAHQGYGSRKEVKKLIRKGHVLVNGEVILDDDFKVDIEDDIITIFDEEVNHQQFVYLMLNKPQGVVSARVDEIHRTVLDLIDEYYHDLTIVGRLDIDTEGLLLLSNDGQFIHNVTSNKKGIAKKYYMTLSKPFDSSYLERLETGIKLNDMEYALPAKVEVLSSNELVLTITEGKYHQIKRMMHACDNEVSYLKRIQIGGLVLDQNLQLGSYRALSEDEILLAQE